ncbi:hypothetical protein OBV_04510 [Oscillibacter valericigenes Sjm18-20]|nr:hypothetical protein OBV_04510 [Oscillibacter valericigenes Sjm18-20]
MQLFLQTKTRICGENACEICLCAAEHGVSRTWAASSGPIELLWDDGMPRLGPYKFTGNSALET